MRKIFCMLLVCFLLFGTVPMAAADDPFDLTYVYSRSDDYDVSTDTEEDVTFVTSNMTVKELAFSHADESDSFYSYVWHDMLVIDSSQRTRYPVFRMWISVATEMDYKYISSVTFIVDGQEFTFSDIDDNDWFSMNKGDYVQKLLIKFGESNIDFLIAVERFCNKVAQDDYAGDYSVRMILHGRRDFTGASDTEAVLGLPFLVDFTRIKNAFLNCNGFQFLGKSMATPMVGRLNDR